MKLIVLAVLLPLTITLSSAAAQEARFFRISGPVPATITAVSADGYVTWTNVPTNALFTVQVSAMLTGPVQWADYIRVPVTGALTRERLFCLNPPAGMAFIPAGTFTMGNCMEPSEGDGDELPLLQALRRVF